MLSRRAFIATQGSTAALAALAVADVGAAGIANTVVVGPGGDFPNMAGALAGITDNSEFNPYLIQVLPGVYSADWSTKSWVTVKGSGPLATIFEGAGAGGVKVAQSNCQLRDFGVRYTGSAASDAAIKRSALASGVYLSDLHIEHAGTGSAIDKAGGRVKETWWLRDLRIATEGIGLRLNGHAYCDDLKVMLRGNNTGGPHIGCQVTGNFARVYLNNCRIGTGYWYDYDDSFIDNRVFGDDDVVGILLESGYVGTRVEIHGLESFCRNEDTADASVRVSVVRAEGGWVRAFGCFGQAETPADWSVRKTLFQAGEGKIEQYGCRFSGIEGDSYGASVLGVKTFTVEDDGYVFDKFEDGLHLLDSGDGGFRLRLKRPNFSVPGEVHLFKKVAAANTVTIELNTATLEGSSVDPVLTNQYDTLKIVWDGTEWLRA